MVGGRVIFRYFLKQLSALITLLGLLHMRGKIAEEDNGTTPVVESQSSNDNQRTLMDVVCSKTFLPKLNFPGKRNTIKTFLKKANKNLLSSLLVSSNNESSVNGKLLMFDAIIIQIKNLISGATYHSQHNFHSLITSI